ncbi:MAG: class I SAM-dependent methyltransferase [archaeon]|nr:class I SAM-dependent methyltransferase [archaeon]
MKQDIRVVTECRTCKSAKIKEFLSLGSTPLANSLVAKSELEKPEEVFPLNVVFCPKCGLVQLGHVVKPEKMFTNYLYLTSYSSTMVKHLGEFAKEVAKISGYKNGLVVDIGSNDGTFLASFKKIGFDVLGVEPAKNISKTTNEKGIRTENVFFNIENSKNILEKYGKARIITGTNVFAHVDDLDGLVEGVKILLDDTGFFIIESPYLPDLLHKIEFDTIYHEHLSYLSLKPLVVFFKRHGMKVIDVKRTKIHGGSIRLYVKKKPEKTKPKKSIERLLLYEKKNGINSFKTFREFARKVVALKKELISLLGKLKNDGKTIAGYGASAKGNTLLNYTGIGTETIGFIVDKNPLKQGLYAPGSRIEIFSPEKLVLDRPDYVLLLAWNFKEEIIKQQQEYASLGGNFITPVPWPKIL